MVGARQNYSPHVTIIDDYKIGQATNATDTSFTQKVPTTTEPTNAGVNDIGDGEGVSNNIMLIPFGTGADDTTFDMRVYGWQLFSTVWVPTLLCEFNVTLSTVTGVDGTDLENENRLADTIVLATGNANVSTEVVSNAGNEVAHAVVDVKGFEKIEFHYDRTGATDCNCLWRKLG